MCCVLSPISSVANGAYYPFRLPTGYCLKSCWLTELYFALITATSVYNILPQLEAETTPRHVRTISIGVLNQCSILKHMA
jgi:hypothetical protein